MDYPRRELLDHVAGRQNLCLLVPRQIGTATWRHAFIADAPANDCVISNRSREANQVFPLSRFNSQGAPAENLSPKFRTFLDARFEHHYSPEEILGYIYAVLYAPAYRARYAEFLRIDFPRIPFPESAEHSRPCRAWAGRSCRRICYASSRAQASPPIMARATMPSRRYAIPQRSRRSGSTRASSSSPCRKRCGISTSAGIRRLRNTSSRARGGHYRSTRSTM